ncbi:MAG: uracil-DNA glycosylase [Thermoanaerobaculia bacterium]
MKLPASLREELQYLLDLGFEEVYRRPAAALRAGEPAGHGAPPPRQAPAATGTAAPEPPSSGALTASPAERVARLSELAAQVADCRLCGLCAGRNQTVFGSGDPDARLMFIGEGPGAEEDKRGLPFVGRAGELLTKIIRAIDLGREQVYIANIVKCRPPGNREPQPDEVAACRAYLAEQIDLVHPEVLVALGRVAAQSLLGTDTPIGKMRGQWYTVRGIATMVTYHPAALLRNPALKRPTWEDMQAVRERLGAGRPLP